MDGLALAELKKESGPRPQVEQAGREIRDVLAGHLNDSNLFSSRDRQIRQLVSAELLAATSEEDGEIQQRARSLFIEHGYFDELAHDLRSASTVRERVVAAGRLGRIGTSAAIKHLIAALFDSDGEVREAAAAALRQIEPGRLGEPEIGPTTNSRLEDIASRLRTDVDRNKSGSADDFERLLQEENTLRQALTKLEEQLLEVTTARTQAARELQVSAERAVAFDGEATVLRQEENKFRKYAEAAEARCLAERERNSASQKQTTLLEEEMTRLRVEAGKLKRELLEIEQTRSHLTIARRSEAENARLRAEEDYDSELALLKREEEALRNSCRDLALRRASVERARTAIETKIDSQRHAEIEQRIRREIEGIAEAETESQRRIEQAEAQRQAAKKSLQIAAEKAARFEEEARLRRAEEEHALEELQRLRQSVAAEVEARAKQSLKIRREIEQLRKIDEGDRQSIKEEPHLFVSETDLQLSPDYGDYSREAVPPEIIKKLQSGQSGLRAEALADLARLQTKDGLELIADCLDDPSPDVRNAAALALRQLEPETVVTFTRVFEEATSIRRRNLGAAMADSGLAADLIRSLTGSSREQTHNALCLLFLMAKSGEVEPLVQAIEEEKSLEVRRAAIRLLTLSGQSDAAHAAVKRRLNSNKEQ